MFCLAPNEDHRISGRGPDTTTDDLTACRFDEMSLEHLTNPNRETLVEIGKLRIVAWEASGPRPKMAPQVGDIWTDIHDQHAHHWIVREQGCIVAAARMCVHIPVSDLPDHENYAIYRDIFYWPVASINRLVIHPRLRRIGLPKLFDRVRIISANRLGAKSLIASTERESRIRNLSDVGFKVVGEAPEPVLPGRQTVVLLKVIT